MPPGAHQHGEKIAKETGKETALCWLFEKDTNLGNRQTKEKEGNGPRK
jgi:hypothetical protein